jgi:MinD superfamily P-loop ATPase
MPALKIDHDRCTECRMCYIVCREIDINAVYVALEPLHRIEIDIDKCTYPGCTACLMYCPAEGSIVEVEWSHPRLRHGRRPETCIRSSNSS